MSNPSSGNVQQTEGGQGHRRTPPAQACRTRIAVLGGSFALCAALAAAIWFLTGKVRDPSYIATRPASAHALAASPSRYLREAARQPVQWLPWSEEAFERARREDKPILLDIGAVWCHWCHVMDAESYGNKEIGRLINEGFIPVKVDRDERPDIDRRYQEAVRVLTGGGGWPLTVFLTPQGRPFFGGTYFPPEDRGGQPGLKTILPMLAEAYGSQKADVLSTAEQVSAMLDRFSGDAARPGEISNQLVDLIATNILGEFDSSDGGFGMRAKFPAPGAVEFALMRTFEKGDADMLRVATRTLDAMARGGIHDQIGGGFFRYSTDRKWRVPHFEKMNYDNAGLLINYLHAYQATGRPLYAEVARGIMRYLNEVLSDRAGGGFYAHQDADMTREDDGDYYTWTAREVRRALPAEEAEVLLRYYDIRPQGEMRGKPSRNVLFVATTPRAIGRELGLPVEEVRRRIEKGKERLLKARHNRKPPLVDRTLYTDRNGMLVSAYLEAYKYLGDEQARDFAIRTLERLLREAYREGEGMYHACFNGKARLPGLLSDQVWTAAALLDAFEVTGDRRYLQTARNLMDHAIDHFWDPKGGGFFDRRPQAEALADLSRPVKDIADIPSASSNGVAARLLSRLSYLTNDPGYDLKAAETLKSFAGTADGFGSSGAFYALAVHYHLNKPAQAVIIGKKSLPDTRALWKSALTAYRPGKLVAAYDPAEARLESLPPSVAGAVKLFGTEGEPKAYICAGATCAPPTTDPGEAAELVKGYGLERS